MFFLYTYTYIHARERRGATAPRCCSRALYTPSSTIKHLYCYIAGVRIPSRSRALFILLLYNIQHKGQGSDTHCYTHLSCPADTDRRYRATEKLLNAEDDYRECLCSANELYARPLARNYPEFHDVIFQPLAGLALVSAELCRRVSTYCFQCLGARKCEECGKSEPTRGA